VPVKFSVLPSLYVPVAMNCCAFPAAIEGFVGVTEIEARTGEVTVIVAAPCTVPEVAVIVVIPTMTPVARPAELIIATGDPELHPTEEVTSSILASLYVPMASNCTDKPAGVVPFAGVTVIDTRGAGPTVSVAELLVMPERLAVMFVVPAATAVASPVLLAVAADVLEEFHAAELLRSVVEPSA